MYSAMVPSTGRGETRDGSDQEHVIAGGGRDVPTAAADVVGVEGSAPPASEEGQASSWTAWLFRPGVEPRELALGDLEVAVSQDENLVWIDLSGYTESDIHRLADLLDLQPPAIRATLAPWQRPRLDLFPGHFFVSATIVRTDQPSHRVEANELDLFVGQNYLLSAHKLPLPFTDRVRARVGQEPDLVRLDSALLLYIVLDELMQYYEDLAEDLEDQVEHMEERALRDTSDEFLSDLLRLKRYLFAITRLAGQHRDVFAAFLRPDFPYVSDHGAGAYFRDLEASLTRVTDTLSGAKDAVNGAFDIYVSHVSHRTNHIMKVLTIVSTVVLPATIVFGFFGTSFRGIPLYGPGQFVIMLSTIVVLTLAVFYAFHRWRWL